MKTKKSITITIGLLIGFVAGLMVGITLTNPGLSLIEAAGTIGKMDSYRNVRVTEQDIELRNELLSDASMKDAYQQYLLYEYTINVKMADDIHFAILESDRIPGFRSVNSRTMNRLEDYAMFLDNARLLILEAIGVINELDGRSQVAIRTVLNNAGNALAQTTYRSTVLFDFIDGVQQFINLNGKETHPQLALAHDKLYANLLAACLVNDNRPVLEHLLERDVLTEDESLALNSEALMAQLLNDASQLSSSSALLSNTEQLQGIVFNSTLLLDMGMLEGVQQLSSASFLSNTEQLSAFTQTLRAFEISSVQQLSALSMLDAEQLGSQVIRDAEFLGVFNATMLQGIQQLSSSADLFNAQQLNSFPGASDQLSGRQSIQ